MSVRPYELKPMYVTATHRVSSQIRAHQAHDLRVTESALQLKVLMMLSSHIVDGSKFCNSLMDHFSVGPNAHAYH